MNSHALLDALLDAFLGWLYGRIESHFVPPQPRPFRFSVEHTMATKFQVSATTIAFPAVAEGASPLASATLKVSADGGPQSDVPLALTDTSAVLGAFDDKAVVTAELWVTNAAGFQSLHRTEAVTIDSAAFPPEPGPFGFSIIEVETP